MLQPPEPHRRSATPSVRHAPVMACRTARRSDVLLTRTRIVNNGDILALVCPRDGPEARILAHTWSVGLGRLGAHTHSWP